jgi:hypothetical protein
VRPGLLSFIEKSGKRIERCVVSTLQTAESIDFRQREQIAGVIVGLEFTTAEL